MANNIIFDESHYFMCTNGLKPARMKSNQTVLYREDGNYYLTVYSLKCKGLDFSCRWAALVMAIVAAVIALLCSCPAGWVLLAALGGAVAGACLGSAICGDMAAIMRIWVVIKTDASISGYDMVSNKMTPQLQCGVFSGVISYVPNVKTVFDEYFIFAYNTLGAGLEGFMYAYAFRGVGLLATAPKTFLCNFAANFLKSWSLTGVVFRGAFAEIARRDTYYNSETEGHDREKENTAFAKAFFFERAVAENIHEAVTSDEENAWKKSLHIAKSVAPVLAMGGIQGGKKVGNEILDATQSDVIAAAKETVPAKIAEQIKKGIDAAKEYRSQLRNQSKGVGAEEAGKPVLPDAPENMQFSGRRPANPEYKVIDENGNLTEYGKWYYERPTNYRSGVRKETWDNAVENSIDGQVRDPITGEIMDPNEKWDMGHEYGYEFRKHQKSAAERGIGREQFMDEYNIVVDENGNTHYRPELPSSNRGHTGEAPDDVYYGQ